MTKFTNLTIFIGGLNMPIAYLDDSNVITLVHDTEINGDDVIDVIQKDIDHDIHKIEFNGMHATIELAQEINLERATQVYFNDYMLPLQMGKYTTLPSFDEKYATDLPMGPIYNREHTIFRVFAPTAIKIYLRLDDTPYEMIRTDGYYEVTVEGDCHGKLFHYEVTHDHVVHFVNDPYVKSLTANGKRGMVIDVDRVEPDNVLESNISPENGDVIIYEAHVRDMTSHINSGVDDDLRFKYIGIDTNQTSSYGLPTGIDYIKSLGVTHVQLLPVNDFQTVDELKQHESYNWGYDPAYFMAPEGSYATEPDNPILRVKELKTLINRLHASGLKVIFDVVLNHVYAVEDNAFQKLVPNYYFRFNDDNFTLSDGTGVGNDLATERKMMSRFVVETIMYWLEAYNIDGYRFDLMGAMDTDTIAALREASSQLDRDVFLLGEGWHLDTNLPDDKKTVPENKAQVPGVHFFNDQLRDALKGSTFELEVGGYVHGSGDNAHELRELFIGNMEPFDPSMTINYVEAHDNHTLFDRLNSDEWHPIVIERQHQMATALGILAFGTPFIHAGQEFLRTKDGHENSYDMMDETNQMDWDRAAHYQDNIQFVRDVIQFRKDNTVFQFKTAKEVHPCVDYIMRDEQEEFFALRVMHDGVTHIILANPRTEDHYFFIAEGETFEVVLSNVRTRDTARYEHSLLLKPYEVIIVKVVE